MRMYLDIINKVFLNSKLIKAKIPYFINEGECFKWAYCAYSLYGGQLCSTLYHAFVKIDDRYYDAEALKGVPDWQELRVNKECLAYRIPLIAQELEEEDFLSSWQLDPNTLLPLLSDIKKHFKK